MLPRYSGDRTDSPCTRQIFQSVGLSSSSAGLFATGIYGVVKVVFTSLALLFGVEQAGRKVSRSSEYPMASMSSL